MREKLITFERKWRLLLYSFVCYTLLYSTVSQVFPEQADSIVHNIFYILIAGAFSICGGLVIDEKVEETKEEYEINWIAKSKSDYYCLEFSGATWIGTFYVMVQMGIVMMFFPEFEQIKIGSTDQYLYPYLYIFNSIVIYILYRLTIIKIEWEKGEGEDEQQSVETETGNQKERRRD